MTDAQDNVNKAFDKLFNLDGSRKTFFEQLKQIEARDSDWETEDDYASAREDRRTLLNRVKRLTEALEICAKMDQTLLLYEAKVARKALEDE